MKYLTLAGQAKTPTPTALKSNGAHNLFNVIGIPGKNVIPNMQNPAPIMQNFNWRSMCGGACLCPSPMCSVRCWCGIYHRCHFTPGSRPEKTSHAVSPSQTSIAARLAKPKEAITGLCRTSPTHIVINNSININQLTTFYTPLTGDSLKYKNEIRCYVA